MDQDKDFKKIFEEYFRIIDSFLGSIKHYLGRDESAHIWLGERIAHYPFISDLVLDAIDDVGDAISSFWNQNSAFVKAHIQQQTGLKCFYSGDISPLSLEDFVKRTGLYVDTIIIPDPFFNISVVMKPAIRKRKFYLEKLIRHVFNVWRMKDLILADTKYKILVLYPASIALISKEKRESLVTAAELKFVTYMGNLFEREFSGTEELKQFLMNINRGDELSRKIKRPAILPNQFKSPENLEKNMKRMATIRQSFTGTKFSSVGESFFFYIDSQFVRVEEHKYYCNGFQAEPIYDYELPWFFLNYDMGGQDIDAAIMNALQREQFVWIGNVPLSAIKVLREQDKMEYMRSVLRNGILSITTKKDQNLSLVINQLQDNFQEAFRKQKLEQELLQSEVQKILKKKIPLTIIGFLVGFIPYVGNFITLPFAAKELFGSYKETKEKLCLEQKSPVNLLMCSYEKT